MSFRALLLSAISATCLASAAFAQEKNTSAPVTHGEFQDLLKETLVKNPDIMRQVMIKLHDNQLELTRKEIGEGIKTNAEALFKDTASPGIGAKNPDVTLVEFFDYHCGYCKRLLPTVRKLVEEDKNIRVLFREFPILSEDSVLAARAALAVNRLAPDKYFDYHTALMEMSGKFDETALTAAAKNQGVDIEKFKALLQDKSITEQIDKTRDLADDLGIRGTPALVLKDRMLPGAVGYDKLKQSVEDVRKGKPELMPKMGK